jgi:hypothetical protein
VPLGRQREEKQFATNGAAGEMGFPNEPLVSRILDAINMLEIIREADHGNE